MRRDPSVLHAKEIAEGFAPSGIGNRASALHRCALKPLVCVLQHIDQCADKDDVELHRILICRQTDNHQQPNLPLICLNRLRLRYPSN